MPSRHEYGTNLTEFPGWLATAKKIAQLSWLTAGVSGRLEYLGAVAVLARKPPVRKFARLEMGLETPETKRIHVPRPRPLRVPAQPDPQPGPARQDPDKAPSQQPAPARQV
jgi:hypothetical protein